MHCAPPVSKSPCQRFWQVHSGMEQMVCLLAVFVHREETGDEGGGGGGGGSARSLQLTASKISSETALPKQPLSTHTVSQTEVGVCVCVDKAPPPSMPSLSQAMIPAELLTPVASACARTCRHGNHTSAHNFRAMWKWFYDSPPCPSFKFWTAKRLERN